MPARQAAGVERLGVMPIENLSSDAQLDWRSRAAAAVVVYDLAGAKNIFAKQVDSLSAAQSMQASRLLEGYFFERNGRIGIRATLEDLERTKAVESFEIDGAAAAGFLPLANELARKLSSDARTVRHEQRECVSILTVRRWLRGTRRTAEQALQQPRDADPGFAAAYVDASQAAGGNGRSRGRAAGGGGRRERRAWIRLNGPIWNMSRRARAEMQRDRMKALESLTAATPANANIFRELGETRFARRRVPASGDGISCGRAVWIRTSRETGTSWAMRWRGRRI